MTTTLTIPDLPDDVADRLRARAARSGRTLEAEVRTLLGDAAAGADTARSRTAWRDAVLAAQAAFAPLAHPAQSVVDELIADRRHEARRDDEVTSSHSLGTG